MHDWEQFVMVHCSRRLSPNRDTIFIIYLKQSLLLLAKELLQRDTSIVASSLSGSEGRKNFPKKCRSVSNDAGKPSPSIAKKVSAFNSSKSVTKARALSRVYSNLYETSSDTLDDESMTLNKLQQRHLADKNMVDRLFKRGLYSWWCNFQINHSTNEKKQKESRY